MGGGQTTQDTQQQSTMQLPPWVNQAAQQNYAFAQEVANRPLQQYQGQLVATPGGASTQAWNLAQTGGNAGAGYYQPAQAGYMGILGQGAPQVTAGSIANTNLAPYMNPYTSSVIDNSMKIMNQNLAGQLASNASTASQAGAFGGSRQAVQNAVNQAQTNLQGGLLASQLNQDAFKTALGTAGQDIATQLSAATANQGAELQNRNLGILAAGGLTNLGQQANQNLLANWGILDQSGQEQTKTAQDIINAQQGKFQQAWNYPSDQLNTLLASLGMTPYEKSQTTTGKTVTETSPDLAMSGLGMLSVLGGLFKSDINAKKNIQPVGTDPGTGLKISAFQYKGQPKQSPKFVGPMAQDVEKKFPGSTISVGGTKFIKGGQAIRRGIPLPRMRGAGILAR